MTPPEKLRKFSAFFFFVNETFCIVCIAAKYGNTEVARCLCLAGARIDAKNREGVVAEVCARVQGHASLGTPLFDLPPPPSLFSSAFLHVYVLFSTFALPFPQTLFLYRPCFSPSIKEFK